MAFMQDDINQNVRMPHSHLTCQQGEALACFSASLIARKGTYLFGVLVFGNLADNSSDPRRFVFWLEAILAVLLIVESILLATMTKD
jgi:hypothetical protein